MIAANKVHETLSKYILTDGFNHVADLKKSHGPFFVDARDGKEYVDCYSMHAAMPLSWNYPKLKQYEHELHELVFHNPSNSDCYTPQYAEFVEAFAKVTPDFNHYFFVAGGTLAVENALKAAFDYKAQRLGITDAEANKLDVVHFQHAFHGRSGYTLSLTNTGENKTKWFPKWNWTRVSPPAVNLCAKDIEAFEHSALQHIARHLEGGMVAAVILEPIQGEGGDNHFRPEFMQELRRLTHEYDAMLIMDEVQTGVGMTGKMWCYEHYGIVPDMITFGKKTQVCGFACTSWIDNVKNNVFNTSSRINSTWGGNLIDMVRCKIYLQIIKEDNLVQNAAEVGAYFLHKLQETGVKKARGKGLYIAFDLDSPEQRDAVFNKLSQKVLCLKCGSVSIRFRPHLDFGIEHANIVVDAVRQAIV